jgi:hypothetical protein
MRETRLWNCRRRRVQLGCSCERGRVRREVRLRRSSFGNTRKSEPHRSDLSTARRFFDRCSAPIPTRSSACRIGHRRRGHANASLPERRSNAAPHPDGFLGRTEKGRSPASRCPSPSGLGRNNLAPDSTPRPVLALSRIVRLAVRFLPHGVTSELLFSGVPPSDRRRAHRVPDRSAVCRVLRSSAGCLATALTSSG